MRGGHSSTLLCLVNSALTGTLYLLVLFVGIIILSVINSTVLILAFCCALVAFLFCAHTEPRTFKVSRIISTVCFFIPVCLFFVVRAVGNASHRIYR